ncbi:MAG: cytochrome c family protein [SAR324 cluster bacterium]|nr:cytochrome c family protein [SAR324 cluster bacterium]
MWKKGVIVLSMLGLVWAFPLSGQSQAKPAKYVGVNQCKKCHKSEKEGEQFKIWQKTKLAKSFETLKSDKALEAAKKIGFTGVPSESAECLTCHVTGYGEDKKMFDKKFSMEDGVQCESCHGPGSNYKSKKVKKELHRLKMELAKLKEGTPEYDKTASALKTERENLKEKFGLSLGTKENCTQCHAAEITVGGKTFKNPSWDPKKGFDFEQAKKDIAHPRGPYDDGGSDKADDADEDDKE